MSSTMRTPNRFVLLLSAVSAVLCVSCAPDEATIRAAEEANGHVVAVDPSHFISGVLIGEVMKEERRLADGTKAWCYVIRTYSEPNEHEMGPWAPRSITDDAALGGIWIRDGVVYDVDGPFIKNIAEFYGDPEWKLHRDDGSVRVTDTKEAFEAAARPDVDSRYYNHVVEGRPEWFGRHENTYVIPINPVYKTSPTTLRRGAVAVAFNGVKYDPPAPLHAILGAHTIAPFDDAGGHMNPFEGYHYHAATGQTKEIEQADGHAPMIGYALDGFGLYAYRDEKGQAASDLDECGGHFDPTRGYHYHAGAPGSNQIIRAFRGQPGTMTLDL